MKETIEKVTIMEIDFINTTKVDFLQNHLSPRLIQQKKSFIVTANPEIVMKTREDADYKGIVQSADYVTPDGIGILMAAKYLKQPMHERISGYDLMLDLLDFAETEGLSYYFLGAEDNINKKAIMNIEKQYPNLTIAGNHHGFFDIDDVNVVEGVLETNPDIVFVALGLPRQEQWIANSMDRFNKGLFIGVGGSFDVIAGEVKRAPDKWIKLNLEWLYRLLQQPFRSKRILKIFEFMLRVIFKK